MKQVCFNHVSWKEVTCDEAAVMCQATALLPDEVLVALWFANSESRSPTNFRHFEGTSG
jgi:hypothetical protein